MKSINSSLVPFNRAANLELFLLNLSIFIVTSQHIVVSFTRKFALSCQYDFLFIICIKAKIGVLDKKCTGKFLRAGPVLREGGRAQSLGGEFTVQFLET